MNIVFRSALVAVVGVMCSQIFSQALSAQEIEAAPPPVKVQPSLSGVQAFTISATDVSVVSGSSAQSTVTITPSSGVTGTVGLSCSVSNSAGTAQPPTCSIQQTVHIGGGPTVTSMTVNALPLFGAQRGRVFPSAGVFLAALLLLWLPAGGRRRFTRLACAGLVAVGFAGLTGCGGGASAPAGATPGFYAGSIVGSSTDGYGNTYTVTAHVGISVNGR